MHYLREFLEQVEEHLGMAGLFWVCLVLPTFLLTLFVTLTIRLGFWESGYWWELWYSCLEILT